MKMKKYKSITICDSYKSANKALLDKLKFTNDILYKMSIKPHRSGTFILYCEWIER